MVKLNINMPADCKSCPFKGARLCYIAVWLGMEYREVPEDGKPEWCPMMEVEHVIDIDNNSMVMEGNICQV